MADWIKYLNASELAVLIALDSGIWEHQARRRQLMNRAKQRKHRADRNAEPGN